MTSLLCWLGCCGSDWDCETPRVGLNQRYQTGPLSWILSLCHGLRWLWGLVPSNLSILRKNDASNSQWFPVVLCCSRNRVFVIWFESLHFCENKIITDKQQCAQMCRGVACKPGGQESAIRKASLHADHPPMCPKMRCECTIPTRWLFFTFKWFDRDSILTGTAVLHCFIQWITF